mmetsp:Transcript_2093/g.4868  ORF Transcript_2093/g.4868 Transcript_2093/m.4868 type:complete len:227 (-) Transcript_2093:17-697(-)
MPCPDAAEDGPLPGGMEPFPPPTTGGIIMLAPPGPPIWPPGLRPPGTTYTVGWWANPPFCESRLGSTNTGAGRMKLFKPDGPPLSIGPGRPAPCTLPPFKFSESAQAICSSSPSCTRRRANSASARSCSARAVALPPAGPTAAAGVAAAAGAAFALGCERRNILLQQSCSSYFRLNLSGSVSCAMRPRGEGRPWHRFMVIPWRERKAYRIREVSKLQNQNYCDSNL